MILTGFRRFSADIENYGVECTGVGEGGDNMVLAAGGADGSDVTAEAVTARQGVSRSIQGVSLDIRKHHAALAVAAGAPV